MKLVYNTAIVNNSTFDDKYINISGRAVTFGITNYNGYNYTKEGAKIANNGKIKLFKDHQYDIDNVIGYAELIINNDGIDFNASILKDAIGQVNVNKIEEGLVNEVSTGVLHLKKRRIEGTEDYEILDYIIKELSIVGMGADETAIFKANSFDLEEQKKDNKQDELKLAKNEVIAIETKIDKEIKEKENFNKKEKKDSEIKGKKTILKEKNIKKDKKTKNNTHNNLLSNKEASKERILSVDTDDQEAQSITQEIAENADLGKTNQNNILKINKMKVFKNGLSPFINEDIDFNLFAEQAQKAVNAIKNGERIVLSVNETTTLDTSKEYAGKEISDVVFSAYNGDYNLLFNLAEVIPTSESAVVVSEYLDEDMTEFPKAQIDQNGNLVQENVVKTVTKEEINEIIERVKPIYVRKNLAKFINDVKPEIAARHIARMATLLSRNLMAVALTGKAQYLGGTNTSKFGNGIMNSSTQLTSTYTGDLNNAAISNALGLLESNFDSVDYTRLVLFVNPIDFRTKLQRENTNAKFAYNVLSGGNALTRSSNTEYEPINVIISPYVPSGEAYIQDMSKFYVFPATDMIFEQVSDLDANVNKYELRTNLAMHAYKPVKITLATQQ